MNNTSNGPVLTSDGITFGVMVDYKWHACLLSTDALTNLNQLSVIDRDPMATYDAYETKIAGVARRLVTAGVLTSPIILGPKNFR